MKFKSEIVIGLEVHIQLDSDTKLFCSCPTKGSEEPNTRVCVTCLGMPGSKPVLNKKAIEYALRLALGTDSKITKELIFSRKSYFYPDMSKNYQISQYEIPLATRGKLKLKSGKEVNLVRIHLEEDPASLVHPGSMQQSPYVLVDYNRSGNPLLEIVTEPELTSPEEARDFMKQLITVLQYLEIFDIDNGIIKADANISIKESGYIRSEVKNVTGFKEIERALRYEVERQKQEVKTKKLKMETRAWDSDRGVTFSLRSKETEEDYGYIIDSDLVRIELAEEIVSKIKKEMPELAADKIGKFVDKHKIKKEDAEIISQERELAELFERVAVEIDPILAAKWLRRELMRVLNYNKKTLKDIKLDEKNLITLLKLIETKKITEKTGQRLMEKLIEKPFDVNDYVKKEGLGLVSDKKEIEKFCKEAIKENPKAVEDYKSGEEKALNFVVGQVMGKSRGKAKPDIVKEIILKNI
jgi:aspartyl-tRNA(Asn)/glutamyl-tRNA(Gln) amidotransferase subunit B|tara:strand:+ start:1455 stop:2861 length:1407 start_codon:yes stop_codon:yes gene_type:complete